MAKEVIAFDIGGTHMRAALVKDKRIIDFDKCNTPKTKDEFLNKMHYFIEKFNSGKVKGIGIGIAGPVNKGKLLNAPNLPIQDFDFKKHLTKKYKKRVEVENDAGCFTKAQLILGPKLNNFILITIGTGIGGGIVINKKPYRGEGLGAEFGHMYIAGDEWEHHWKATKRKIEREFGKGALVSDLAKKRTTKGRKILEESADYMGKSIASLISAFDPEIVYLGGGVEESGNYFLDMIKKSADKYTFLPKKTPIKWTTVKKPGIMGASLLVS